MTLLGKGADTFEMVDADSVESIDPKKHPIIIALEFDPDAETCGTCEQPGHHTELKVIARAGVEPSLILDMMVGAAKDFAKANGMHVVSGTASSDPALGPLGGLLLGMIMGDKRTRGRLLNLFNDDDDVEDEGEKAADEKAKEDAKG